jgi:murein DD-endopeptidase MepM/ murein hydrolase activator NlpD
MRFGSPVGATIYTKQLGSRWYLSQPFGGNAFFWEPKGFGYAHYHRGIDVARSDGSCGDRATAAAAGTVIWAGPLNDGNIAVVIRHAGGWATGYSHLRERTVSKGRTVAKGQKVGAVGRTGLATGCHLHFAAKTDFPAGGDVNDFYLDPYSDPPGGKGRWADPWTHLDQNGQAELTHVRPKGPGINIRFKSATTSAVYATTEPSGLIRRVSDGTSLGTTAEMRRYGGRVKGGDWRVEIDGKVVTGDTWDEIWLGNAYRFIASALTARS